ncbi:MAG: hypothetical protein NT138_24825 [Planctomycetales bacterium]|jgi:hypothetical protein|nr:hypothetical protein [Planctomycetales bacterium]
MKLVRKFLLGMFLAAVSAAAVFIWNGLKPGTVPDTPLASRRVAPVTEMIPATSMESVDVTWEVRNQTMEPMRGLKAQTDCQCRIREAFPAVLHPGETARVSIRLTAPNAGVAQRSLPVFCDNMPVSVGTLQVTFRVDVKAPFWLQPPKMVRLQGVTGQTSEHEIVWESIESPIAQKLIEDIRCEGNAQSISMDLQSIDQPWTDDGTLVKRKYAVHIQLEPVAADTSSFTLLFDSQNPEAPRPITIQTQIQPALSAFPPQLTFCELETLQHTVTVVNRLRKRGPIEFFAPTGVTIRRVNPSTEATQQSAVQFEVRLSQDRSVFNNAVSPAIQFVSAGTEVLVPLLCKKEN